MLHLDFYRNFGLVENIAYTQDQVSFNYRGYLVQLRVAPEDSPKVELLVSQWINEHLDKRYEAIRNLRDLASDGKICDLILDKVSTFKHHITFTYAGRPHTINGHGNWPHDPLERLDMTCYRAVDLYDRLSMEPLDYLQTLIAKGKIIKFTERPIEIVAETSIRGYEVSFMYGDRNEVRARCFSFGAQLPKAQTYAKAVDMMDKNSYRDASEIDQIFEMLDVKWINDGVSLVHRGQSYEVKDLKWIELDPTARRVRFFDGMKPVLVDLNDFLTSQKDAVVSSTSSCSSSLPEASSSCVDLDRSDVTV